MRRTGIKEIGVETVTPMSFNVLVKLREPVKKIGSILVSDETSEIEQMRDVIGTIAAMGPTAFKSDDFGSDDTPKVGDTVMFQANAGKFTQLPDGAYRMMSDIAVIARVKLTEKADV